MSPSGAGGIRIARSFFRTPGVEVNQYRDDKEDDAGWKGCSCKQVIALQAKVNEPSVKIKAGIG